VAQLVAALITVHGLLFFLSDVYGLFDPSGKTLWLSVDYRRLRPVDDIVLLGCVVGEADLLCSVKLDARRLLVNGVGIVWEGNVLGIYPGGNVRIPGLYTSLFAKRQQQQIKAKTKQT